MAKGSLLVKHNTLDVLIAAINAQPDVELLHAA